MTYRAVISDPEYVTPVLHRPMRFRRPATTPSQPCALGDLPAFLKQAEAGPGTAWSERDAPVNVSAFDPSEDVLSLQFDAEQEMPELTFVEDEERAVTTLFADGKPVAYVHLSRLGFSLDNVVVTQPDGYRPSNLAARFS